MDSAVGRLPRHQRTVVASSAAFARRHRIEQAQVDSEDALAGTALVSAGSKRHHDQVEQERDYNVEWLEGISNQMQHFTIEQLQWLVQIAGNEIYKKRKHAPPPTPTQ